MSSEVDIEWNGFLKQCCENYPNESCGILFAKTPFQLTEKWFVFPVDNVAVDKTKEWQPDKKQLAKVKKKAKELGLTRIGNIHSHPFPKDIERTDDIIEYLRYPSKMDLRYAKKFNDIVRGILVVDDKTIYGHLFHDQFGVPLPDLYLNGVNHRENFWFWNYFHDELEEDK